MIRKLIEMKPFMEFRAIATPLSIIPNWQNLSGEAVKGEPWSLTSAVDDLKIDFTLSPNPVRNQLTISSDEPDLSYSIFNLNGQLLQENDLYGTQVISVDNFE